MSLLDTLERIDDALRAKGAPAGWLRDGASAEDLERAEAAMGRSLPAEWKELYLRHDGESGALGLFLGLPWLSLEEMTLGWQGWKDLEAEYADEGTHYSVPPGAIRERYIQSGWLPISHDWGGNHLGIDLSPDFRGEPGQIINFGRDEEIKYVIAHDPKDLFNFLLQEIASDRCSLVDDGGDSPRLEWSQGSLLGGSLSNLALPLFHPIDRAPRPLENLEDWKASLPQPWPALIRSPETFLDSRMLYLMNKGLTDIGPVRHCGNLLALFIAGNQVTDLAPMADLPLLKTLGAQGNPIESLESLSNVSGLRDLRLSKTLIRDLTPLARLSALEELNLADTIVEDLRPLAGLALLHTLELPSSARDLQPLAHMRSLNSLELRVVQGARLDQLARLTCLQKLKIHVTPGVDLEPLRQLQGLRVLTLVGASGDSTEFLEGLPDLEELHLENCMLTNLDSLANHGGLRVFSSQDTTVDNLAGLVTCSALVTVRCSFEQFAYLKDRVDRKLDFSSMYGGMTNEQSEIWVAYSRS